MKDYELVYLAIPYSHKDPEVVEARFNLANEVSAQLMQNGNYVFSPISHSHPIMKKGNLPGDFDYWRTYDHLMMKNCTDLVIVMCDGWMESKGVKYEILLAQSLKISTHFLAPTIVDSEIRWLNFMPDGIGSTSKPLKIQHFKGSPAIPAWRVEKPIESLLGSPVMGSAIGEGHTLYEALVEVKKDWEVINESLWY